MQPIKALIVDDEFQSRNFLNKMLQEYFPEISVIGQASTVEERLQGIKENNPNIVFLDIQMKGETGFNASSVMVPTLLIQPFVENAIWHGLHPECKSVGKININMHLQDDLLHRIIQDNGIGSVKPIGVER